MKQKNLILMVVAVGCGLVAAFLTSQMSAKPASDKIEVIVAARDLTVGTSLTKDDLKTAVKRKMVSKDAVPPTVIENEEELLEKRITRTIRTEEMINKADLNKGSIVSIPPGQSMVALPIGLPQAVAGFVLPGSKVDVLASVRLDNKIVVLPLLVNMLVLAVDASTAAPSGVAAYQALSTVSFAVNRQQAMLIKLAQARACDLSLLLRNQEDKETEIDRSYKIDEVVKLLEDRTRNDLQVGPDGESVAAKKPAPKADGESVLPAPTPKVEVVKVHAASEDIAAGTLITNDLIAAKFKIIELPKELATDAVADLAPFVDEKLVLRNGLGKGQWVTRSLVGNAELKAPPREEFSVPKPGPVEPTPSGRKTRDVAVHTASGTKYFRYEEVAPDEWKLLGERPVGRPAEQPKSMPTPEKVD